jgi:hypothetical protein
MNQTVKPLTFSAAARIQMDLLLRLRRVRGVMIGCAGAAIVLEVLQARIDSIEPTPGAFTGVRFIAIALLALAWGASIWRGEGPKNRSYFLSHPVDASVHELSRIAAGAGWLVVAIGGAVIVALIGATVRHAAGGGTVDGPLASIGLFTGAVLVYLMVAAVSTLTSRVAEVVILAYASMVLVVPLLSMAGFGRSVGRILTPIMVGTFGFRAALVAPVEATPSAIGVWTGALVIWYVVAGALIGGAVWWRRGRLASR